MTTDRLRELRDELTTKTTAGKELRQEQLALVPAARGAGATTTELASHFGISRAAFYKNGYAKIAPNAEGAPAELPELLDEIATLTSELAAIEEETIALRRERDQLIRDELSQSTDTWVNIAQRAGVSEEWLNRLRSKA